MPLVQFSSAAILSYLGLPAGFLLARFTQEELPTARKYLPWIQRLILIVAAAVAMNYLHLSLVIRLVGYAALLVLIATLFRLELFYLLLGFAVFTVSGNQNALLLLLSLVFLFGLVSGSQSFVKKSLWNNLLRLLARNAGYFVAVLLYALLR